MGSRSDLTSNFSADVPTADKSAANKCFLGLPSAVTIKAAKELYKLDSSGATAEWINETWGIALSPYDMLDEESIAYSINLAILTKYKNESEAFAGTAAPFAKARTKKSTSKSAARAVCNSAVQGTPTPDSKGDINVLLMDLTVEAEALRLMSSSTSEDSWNYNCSFVLSANSGFPTWWYDHVVGAAMRNSNLDLSRLNSTTWMFPDVYPSY